MFAPVFESVFRPVFAPVFGTGQGGATPPPFTSDENTYFFDFKSTSNTYDTIADDTIAVAPEVIGAKTPLRQITKDYQLLKNVNGAEGQLNDNRFLLFDNGAEPFLNGVTDGYYVAANINVTSGDFDLMQLVDSNEIRVYVTSSRAVGVRHKYGSTFNWAFFKNSAITHGAWVTVEVLFQYDLNHKIWIDGVLQTGLNTYTQTFNTYSGGQGIEVHGGNGVMQNLALYNGIPPTAIREAASAYLNNERPI